MQPGIVDLRGRLPVHNDPDPGYRYEARPLDAITGITLHYTAGPAEQTAAAIAAYLTSTAAAQQTGTGRPFPGMAYTILVTADGAANLCWDLDVRTWHSAARVNGLSRNLTNAGICYTGNQSPNPAQVQGLARAIAWVCSRLGRTLAIEGHRDAPYATQCPGPEWPVWRTAVMQAVAALTGGEAPDAFRVSAPFRDFLARHPDWGQPRMDEEAFTGGALLWTTPTSRHPKGGLLVYRTWLGQVRAVSWE
jgi:hypothetical protein